MLLLSPHALLILGRRVAPFCLIRCVAQDALKVICFVTMQRCRLLDARPPIDPDSYRKAQPEAAGASPSPSRRPQSVVRTGPDRWEQLLPNSRTWTPTASTASQETSDTGRRPPRNPPAASQQAPAAQRPSYTGRVMVPTVGRPLKADRGPRPLLGDRGP